MLSYLDSIHNSTEERAEEVGGWMREGRLAGGWLTVWVIRLRSGIVERIMAGI